MRPHPEIIQRRRSKRGPIRVGSLTFVHAQILFVSNGRSVLEIEWREGRDTHVEMRVAIGRG